MKNLRLLIAILAFTFTGITMAIASNSPEPIAVHYQVEAADGGISVKICFYVNDHFCCIEVALDVGIKLGPDERITVKANMTRDGKGVLLSGFPPSFKNKSFKINQKQFSGFYYQNSKLFMQAGTYKIVNGGTIVRLGR